MTVCLTLREAMEGEFMAKKVESKVRNGGSSTRICEAYQNPEGAVVYRILSRQSKVRTRQELFLNRDKQGGLGGLHGLLSVDQYLEQCLSSPGLLRWDRWEIEITATAVFFPRLPIFGSSFG